MQSVQVKLIEDVFTPAQQREVIGKITDAMAAEEAETKPRITWVVIEDMAGAN